VNYTQARAQIKSGDLLAWSHRVPFWHSYRDFKIALIRLFTRSEFTHVGTAVWAGGRLLVLEAVKPVVRLHPVSMLGNFYWVPLPASWTPEAEQYAFAQIGDRYSVLDAIVGYFGMPKDDHREQCAELKIRVAAAAGVCLGDVATPTAVVSKAASYGQTMRFITMEKTP
jgi:hypothetical protein